MLNINIELLFHGNFDLIFINKIIISIEKKNYYYLRYNQWINTFIILLIRYNYKIRSIYNSF